MQNTKDRMKLTRNDVVKYKKTALTKTPKQMIDLLVNEIKLYNDKVEIFFKYNKKPEEETPSKIQVFSQNQKITIGSTQQKVNLNVNCLI